MKKIELIQRKFYSKVRYALVDDIDYDWLVRFNWYLYQNEGIKTFYAEAWIGNKRIKMHQLLMPDPPKGLTPDHKDRNGLNNQRENLRWATQSQQNQNTGKREGIKISSQFKGVCWAEHANRWKARIQIKSKQVNLGYFNTEELAALAYNTAAKKYFGSFAVLNEIPRIQ